MLEQIEPLVLAFDQVAADSVAACRSSACGWARFSTATTAQGPTNKCFRHACSRSVIGDTIRVQQGRAADHGAAGLH